MNTNFKMRIAVAFVAALIAAIGFAPHAMADTQQQFFNYQGQLQENGHPASGSYDLAFELYDDATAGTQIGSTLTSAAHPVTGGLFSIGLNFGNGIFNGTQYYLQVYVNNVALTPRTPIRLSPTAEYSLTAGAVTSGAVTSAGLASASVTRAKLNGASLTFTGNININANSCGYLAFGLGAAQVGDAVLISYGGGQTPPPGIVMGPASVISAGQIRATFCNIRATDYNDSNVSWTVQTFR